MPTNVSRRLFLEYTALLSASALPVTYAFSNPLKDRKFTMSLNPGAIGMEVTPPELLDFAIQLGFEAITVPLSDMGAMSETERMKFVDRMKSENISWGSTNLPIDFRKDKDLYKAGLEDLPPKAAIMQELGATRMNTWIMPTHKHLTYLENFEQHVDRLKPVANILGHYNIRLGLEYVGPKTLMARDKFSFIRTMKETKALLEAIDEPNMGFVLDSFHWYCAEESATDILTLENKDIVVCDLNDARKGFSPAEQIDGKRELPTQSNVIDLHGFLNALVQIGYDGPVRAEPFNQPLREMNNEDAAKTTKSTMDKAFGLIR